VIPIKIHIHKEEAPKESNFIGHIFNNRYRADKILGEGSYGRVYLVFDDKRKIKYIISLVNIFENQNF
jgi:serine/threonine protein kinase